MEETEIFPQLLSDVFILIPRWIIDVNADNFTDLLKFLGTADFRGKLRADQTAWFLVFGNEQTDLPAARACYDWLRPRQFNEVGLEMTLYSRGRVRLESNIDSQGYTG